MFLHASAIVALPSDEAEAERVSIALASTTKRITSPIAVLEAVFALARPEKFGLSVEVVQTIVRSSWKRAGSTSAICPHPSLALSAAHRYGAEHPGLNLGDDLRYALARYYRVPILTTSDRFEETDIATSI